MELSGLEHAARELMFSYGVDPAARLIPDIYEPNVEDSGFTVHADLDLGDEGLQPIQGFRTASVKIGHIPYIADQIADQDAWQEAHDTLLEEDWEQVEYWIGYGSEAEDTALVGVNGRRSTDSELFPYRYEQRIVEIPLGGADEARPYLAYLDSLPEISTPIEHAAGLIHHIQSTPDVDPAAPLHIESHQQAVSVAVDGEAPHNFDGDDWKTAAIIEYCRGNPPLREAKDEISARMADEIYQQVREEAVENGREQGTMTIRRTEDRYQVTVAFGEQDGDVEYATLLSTEPHIP